MDNLLKYRIKALRKQNNIRVVSLATKCQVTEKTMRDWENLSVEDKKSIPSDTLRLIADQFGLQMEEMYSTSDDFVTT